MADKNEKPACKYGEACYQRNEAHLNRFSHPVASQAATSSSESRKRAADDNIGNGENRTESLSPPTATRRVTRSTSKSPKKSPVANTSPRKSPQKSPIEGPSVATASTSSNSRVNHGPNQEHDIDFINDVFDKETRFSQRAEYKQMLKEPAVFINNKFLTEMPDDFFVLWDFCKETATDKQAPEAVFEKFGLHLIGPFDVLAGKFDAAEMFEPGDYLRHWRYYYDTPEFQTIMLKDKTTIHYGYWRDSPGKNCLIARNDESKGCEITHIADNAILAVIHYLDKEVQLTPFNRSNAMAMKKSLEQFAQRRNVTLDTFSSKLKARNNRVVCKTFHKGGLVVPYDRKTTVGYRPLIESDANLKNILKKFVIAEGDQDLISVALEQLQPLITAASIAVDEGDFGNSIELGIDLFCSGSKELHNVLLQLLVNGYSMVNKPQFIAIIKAHLEDRKEGSDVNILQNSVN